MKKTYLFIALAMVAAMSISCKNNKKAAKNADANAEVVAAAKTILADDVLARIDELAESFIDETGKFNVTASITSALTEEEKLLKPDYLLEASQANEMVTKSQKASALAILIVERPIRIAYGMPTEETDEVMARFIAEINTFFSLDEEKDLTPSEKIKKAYEINKERGELASFWQFNFVGTNELAYLISQNPDIFFRNITEEQFAAYDIRFVSCYRAVKEIAKYDEQVAEVLKIFEENRSVDTYEESVKAFGSLAAAKQTFIDTKDVIAARRAEMLK